MLKALLIADQQRLHALVAASLGGSGVQLTIISSLANGIEQAVATSPDLLFVQGRLSGLSVEIVSRHVASHVDQQRTKPIIFVDPGEDPGAVAHSQLCLDLALPDSALESRIAALVKAAQPPSGERPVASPLSPAPTDEFVPDASPVLPKTVSTPIQESPEPADSSPPLPPDSGIASRFGAELDTELARREEEAHSAPPPAVSEPKRDTGQTRVGQAEAAELAARSRRRLATAIISILLLMAVATIFTFFPPGRSTPPTAKGPAVAKSQGRPPATPVLPAVTAKPAQPGAPAAAVTPPPGGTAKPAEPLRDPLPSFVPADRRDPAYAAANPGWERYLDVKQEYKVYWEGGKLMAFQVIDRTGAGLSPTFFTAAMKELAGVRDYRLASKEVKDNHLVKKGTLGKAGRIIIYKNKADSLLQAFVIHFEQERNGRR